MKTIMILISSVLASAAAEPPLKSLEEHTKTMKARAEKTGKELWENTADGYEIKIEAQKLIGRQDDAFIYEATWTSSNNMVIALRRTPEFSLAVDQRVRNEQKVLTNARNLSREGGGSGSLFNPLATTGKMFVIAEPAGDITTLLPDNQTTRSMIFRVLKTCGYDWKDCKEIAKPSEPGFLDKVGGFFSGMKGRMPSSATKTSEHSLEDHVNLEVANTDPVTLRYFHKKPADYLVRIETTEFLGKTAESLKFVTNSYWSGKRAMRVMFLRDPRTDAEVKKRFPSVDTAGVPENPFIKMKVIAKPAECPAALKHHCERDDYGRGDIVFPFKIIRFCRLSFEDCTEP